MVETQSMTFAGLFRQDDVFEVVSRFANEPDFFVLQIGANDGVSNDPIHRALARHKWPALLIEPQPEFFTLLTKHYRRLRSVRCDRRAIAEHTGTIGLHRVAPELILSGETPRWVGGVASLFRDRNALGGKGLSEDGKHLIAAMTTTIEVPCSTLEVLIKDYAITRIDLLVIDAEGADWMILRQLDLARFSPRVILFEFLNLPPDERQAAKSWLEQHDYTLFLGEDGFDVLALKKPPVPVPETMT